jgi:hypothetical protein
MMILISSDDSDANMKYEEMQVDSMDSMETRTTEVKAACRANIATEKKNERKET